MGFFVKNLETGKIQLHFAKSEYIALSPERKTEIKSCFLWSKSVSAWVSRSTRNNWRALEIAKSLQLEDRGTTGEKITFAEQIDRRAERAEDRAERMEARAERASKEADARFHSHNVQAVIDLQGEPVKLGHHSARRHMRLLERADNDMRKGVEAYKKSKHYEERAIAARATASQSDLEDAGFLMRRIREHEANERRLRQNLQKATDKNATEWQNRLEELLEEVEDRLTFYRECLEAVGGIKYGRHNVKAGDFVLIRRSWQEVVRCNPTTVAVPNICYPTVESQRKYAMKYPYAEIESHRTREEIEAAKANANEQE